MYCLTKAFHEAGYRDFPDIAHANDEQLRAYCGQRGLYIIGDNGVAKEPVPKDLRRAIVITSNPTCEHAEYVNDYWQWVESFLRIGRHKRETIIGIVSLP